MQITAVLVDYLVGKGYDSDELSELGKKKAIKFIDLMSQSQGESTDAMAMWLVHVKVFITYLKGEQVDRKWLVKLQSAMSRFKDITSADPVHQEIKALIENAKSETMSDYSSDESD